MTKFGPKLAFLPGLAGSIGALLVGWLVVVAHGLYLARHLFTLSYCLVDHQIIIYATWLEAKTARGDDVSSYNGQG